MNSYNRKKCQVRSFVSHTVPLSNLECFFNSFRAVNWRFLHVLAGAFSRHVFGNSLTKMRLQKIKTMVHGSLLNYRYKRRFEIQPDSARLKHQVFEKIGRLTCVGKWSQKSTHTHHSTLSTSHNPVFSPHLSAWLYPVPLANSTLCTGVHEAASQKNSLHSGLTSPFTPCLERTADGVQFFLFRLCVHAAKCQGG